jgi:hypothetical protein
MIALTMAVALANDESAMKTPEPEIFVL